MSFIKKHIKFKASELFFADAIIFVEGITEEVLLSYYISKDKKFSLENLTHEEFYKILGIKKKLTFFDIVKIEN